MNNNTLDLKPTFIKQYKKTIENFDFNIKETITYDNVFYKLYKLFSKLLSDYISLPLKDRLEFKGYTFLATTLAPPIIGLVYSVITKTEGNLKPLWFIEFKNSGNMYVLIDIVLNTLSIVVTSYIGDSLLQTTSSAIIATIEVGKKFGYPTTAISLVTNYKTIPLIIYEGTKTITNQLNNDKPDLPSLNQFILLMFGYFLLTTIISKKF